MAKLKKSDLKNHLLRSVQLFRVNLDYTVYFYFILTMMFAYHVGASPMRYSSSPHMTRIILPATRLPTASSQRKRKNLQDEINETFSSIETHIPPLKGVMLPSIPSMVVEDEKLLEYQNYLVDLQEQTGLFSAIEPFGQAFEYWIGQFASMTLKQGVSLYTPRPLARMVVQMLRPEAGMTIYDPSARTGGMLLSAANYIRQQGVGTENTHFYGCEESSELWAICKMNLLAQQLENNVIESGSPLIDPFKQVNTFDIIVQNFPLSPDPTNRVQTRRMYAAYFRHVLDSLSPTGRAGILMPSTVLQQNHDEIWRTVVGRDWLEAVVTLPPNVLHGVNGGASVLILNKKKLPERRLQVLFVNLASNIPPTRSRRLELTDADLQPAVHVFDSWETIADFSRLVPTSLIEAQDYTLNVERYPDVNSESPAFNISALLGRYQSAIQKRETAINQLMKTLEDLQMNTPQDVNRET